MKSLTVRVWFLAVCGLGAVAGSPVDAGEKLGLRVSASVAFAPADLVVRATVEADAGNRAIEVVAESADFYRASVIELDGDRAPRTNMFEFRSLPSGSYEVKAILFGGNGAERARARQAVNVIASTRGR